MFLSCYQVIDVYLFQLSTLIKEVHLLASLDQLNVSLKIGFSLLSLDKGILSMITLIASQSPTWWLIENIIPVPGTRINMV